MPHGYVLQQVTWTSHLCAWFVVVLAHLYTSLAAILNGTELPSIDLIPCAALFEVCDVC